MKLKTTQKALLILAFNRPQKLIKTLNSLVDSQLQSRKLYFAIDGPRNDAERLLVDQVEEEVKAFSSQHKLDSIIWKSKVNQGCKLGVSQTISRVLKIEESVIILEDDCVPSKSFLPYCDYLLDLYKTDTQVFMINGTSFVDVPDTANQFRSSKCAFVWGWATWKRAWANYDIGMKDLDNNSGKGVLNAISEYFGKDSEALIQLISTVHNQNIDTWDAQWVYTIWKNHGRTIIPSINLISNTGFGLDSTHTRIITKLSNRPSLEFFGTKFNELEATQAEIQHLDRLQYKYISGSSQPLEIVKANFQAFKHFAYLKLSGKS